MVGYMFSIIVFLTIFSEASEDDTYGCVASHNQYRALHLNTPMIVWNSSLAVQSQQWAEELALKNQMEHSSAEDYGENIFWSSASGATCESAVKSWYDEIQYYNYATGDTVNGSPIGHFTQVVWKSTSSIGVGFAESAAGGTYIVAQYYPKGNVVMMQFGEAIATARARVYGEEVQPLISNEASPTVSPTVRPPTLSPTFTPTPAPTYYEAPITPAPTNGPTASPTQDPLTTVSHLFEELIGEANTEIATIEGDVETAELTYNSSQSTLSTAIANESKAEQDKTNLETTCSATKGTSDTVCSEKNATVPGLEDEIVVFRNVIVLLNGLSTGGELLEEDQEKVRAFISLSEQADPTTIANVIELVEGLISTAEEEIARLEKNCEDNEDLVTACEADYYHAVGVYDAAVKERQDAQNNFDAADGALATINLHAATRIPELRTEINSLEEALQLIQSLD